MFIVDYKNYNGEDGSYSELKMFQLADKTYIVKVYFMEMDFMI